MPDLGVPELLIVAVIVLLLFGPGKAADIGGSLGKSIREFRKATREDDPAPAQTSNSAPPPALTMPSSADVVAPAAEVTGGATARGRFCRDCGTAVASDSQKFCTGCGAALAQPVA
jgi:sec-independent protein translocase protein TatA